MFKSTSGAVDKMIRYQSSVTLRVVVAETGKVLQKKVITQPAPKCKKIYTIGSFDGPWWDVAEVPAKKINDYATAVSKQNVK